MTRCFPIGSIATTDEPMTRWICGPGCRALAARIERPTSNGRSATAVLKMVSPSGTPGPRVSQSSHAQGEAKVLAREAGLLQHRPMRRAQRRLAVNAFDGQLTPR